MKKKSSFLIQYSNYFMPSAWHNKLHLEHFYVQLFMTVNCRIPSGINKIITEKKKKRKIEKESTRGNKYTRGQMFRSALSKADSFHVKYRATCISEVELKKSFNFQVKSRLNSLEPYF